MRINPVSAPKQKQPNGYWFNLLSHFANSDAECIEIIPSQGEYKSVRSLQCTVAGAICRYKFNMSTKRVFDKVYIIKKIHQY